MNLECNWLGWLSAQLANQSALIDTVWNVLSWTRLDSAWLLRLQIARLDLALLLIQSAEGGLACNPLGLAGFWLANLTRLCLSCNTPLNLAWHLIHPAVVQSKQAMRKQQYQ